MGMSPFAAMVATTAIVVMKTLGNPLAVGAAMLSFDSAVAFYMTVSYWMDGKVAFNSAMAFTVRTPMIGFMMTLHRVLSVMVNLMVIASEVFNFFLIISIMVTQRHLRVMNVVMLNTMKCFVLHIMEEIIELMLDLTH